MILCRDLLIVLGHFFFERAIKGSDGPFEGSTAPMIDLGMYTFRIFYISKITLEEYLCMHMYGKYLSQNMHILPLKMMYNLRY